MTLKTKGIFQPGGLQKNPVNEVIIKAVIENLTRGTPLDEFIRNHTIAQDFTTLRTVRGGAMRAGVKIGKSIRWYWTSRRSVSIVYAKNGNTVPMSENCDLMMNLPDKMPNDIDYQRYIKEAEKLLEQIT